MGKIVCISDKTFIEGLNNIGDIVSIHDDDVELSGEAYAAFKVIEIPGIKSIDIQTKLNMLIPPIQIAYKSIAVKDTWCLAPPDQQEVWDDDGIWKVLNIKPKYQANIGTLTPSDEFILSSDLNTTYANKLAIIELKTSINLKAITDNQIECDDLNTEAIKV